MYSKETQALMEAAVDAVIVIDHCGVMTAVNQATQRLFGWEVDELIGRDVSMLMPEPERSAHERYMSHHIGTGETHVIGVGREVQAQRKNGSRFPVRLSVGKIPDTSPPRFVGLVRDLSAEREERARREENAALAQERLTRVARLASMGEMASGVAHELNQPLTAITTYARACERFLAMPAPDFSELREAVREIGAEGQRAGRIIERLRQLVRGDESPRLVALDINDVVDDLRLLLAADARLFDSQLEIITGAALPRLRGDAAQLQQVVLNLVRNAFEALTDEPPGARVVRLTTTETATGDVELSVCDNGAGFPAELSGRLFHPFVTTKKTGTGLGLAMSRTIVQSLGGNIGIRAAEPRGACVFVRLPPAEDEA